MAPGHNPGWYFYANFPPKYSKFLLLLSNTSRGKRNQRCFVIINYEDASNDSYCCIWCRALCFAFISSFKPHNNDLMRWLTSASFYTWRNKGSESVSHLLKIK